MIDNFNDDNFHDDNGIFSVLGSIIENGHEILYLKYNNSPHIKRLGGVYSLKCEEKNAQKWYRSDYAAMQGLNKFIKDFITMEDKHND